jgi:hypothetical protein
MNPAQMHEAWEKDGKLFTLTALFNNQMMLKPECRRQLCLDSGALHYIYTQRCEQLKSNFRWFDVTPVTEDRKEIQEAPAPQADATMVESLLKQVLDLKGRVTALSIRALWGAIILGVLVLWHR